MYGIDCEMCYTIAGLQLTKVAKNTWICNEIFRKPTFCQIITSIPRLQLAQVTVVGVDGRLVYESLVLPDSQVADYNTRFSGITQKDLGEN